MRRSAIRCFLACLLSATMSFSTVAPAFAVARVSHVTVENRAQANGPMVLSGIRIDGVAAPREGEALDDTATVSTDQGVAWDIPVLWVSDDLRLATVAERGEGYLPVLALYVPQGYVLAGDSYDVELSDSLTELFGGSEVVSVHNAATGITYILPASVRDLFVAGESGEAVAAGGHALASEATRADAGSSGESDGGSPGVDGAPSRDEGSASPQRPSLVDIYCAQTARDMLTDEDLEWLVDLIVNILEPQAVEVLLDGFPALCEEAPSRGDAPAPTAGTAQDIAGD